MDRGKGFYNPSTGKITPEYSAALREYGFKAFWGDDASVQPGHLQEVLLHETAVSWLRHRLTRDTASEALGRNTCCFWRTLAPVLRSSQR